MPSSTIDTILSFVDVKVPEALAQRKGPGPLFILISGIQGSGKSYNAYRLFEHLSKHYKTLNISIDDFYLPHNEQLALSKKYEQNPLLQGRGLPGTHDLDLLEAVIKRLNSPEPGVLVIPKYNKAAFNGEGDRAGYAKVKKPIDIVILEGWFLGFQSIPEAKLALFAGENTNSSLALINQFLRRYETILWKNSELNTLGIVLAADDIQNVYTWRVQQEHELIKNTGSGMTDEQVSQFLTRYMQCYKIYYDRFVRSRALGNICNLIIGLDLQRTTTYVLL
ncbi:HBL232Cp [Eremothecium sinecaudum]|uniref:HBL232Cp n=1 Tax=Eremothecium sinecaudum TaxID=45286 RepID=A0A125RDV2_9SACH|nr:HBL232Cp [Eremothecium sinecaudum]AMD18670.1 HBL232Cp [Eremothecium sinecaudum]